jgi:AhpD family alkylhydroperoxidase
MQARMKNPAVILPGAMQAMQALKKATEGAGVPATTLNLVELRASQINGCSVCVLGHTSIMKRAGETEDRIVGVSAWRHMPYFTAPERAALALTEALTRISDREDPVSDPIWAEAARHYDERALAALILDIASINVWNRLNLATAQIAGEWRG